MLFNLSYVFFYKFLTKINFLSKIVYRPGHISVMLAIGNGLANSVWEETIHGGQKKPSPTSSREEKEKWIRNKYEAKEYLPQCNLSMSIGQQLIEAVVRYKKVFYIFQNGKWKRVLIHFFMLLDLILKR